MPERGHTFLERIAEGQGAAVSNRRILHPYSLRPLLAEALFLLFESDIAKKVTIRK